MKQRVQRKKDEMTFRCKRERSWNIYVEFLGGYFFNVLLNFYIMNVIIDHLDPLRGLLYCFKSKWINIVIKRDGNIIFKNSFICNEKPTEFFFDGSNTVFGLAR